MNPIEAEARVRQKRCLDFDHVVYAESFGKCADEIARLQKELDFANLRLENFSNFRKKVANDIYLI
jgi:hypothetical protein